jgi:hypothetical protein
MHDHFIIGAGGGSGEPPADTCAQRDVLMRVWRGWTMSTPTSRALTWSEWCTRQQRALRDEQLRQQGVPFSERELACLSFVRWLCQTGRLDPREHVNV